jgi:hypothetical protein
VKEEITETLIREARLDPPIFELIRARRALVEFEGEKLVGKR